MAGPGSKANSIDKRKSMQVNLAYGRLDRRLATFGLAALVLAGVGVWFSDDGPAELRSLAASFNGMLARLARSGSERERAATRRFAADAGHEPGCRPSRARTWRGSNTRTSIWWSWSARRSTRPPRAIRVWRGPRTCPFTSFRFAAGNRACGSS